MALFTGTSAVDRLNGTAVADVMKGMGGNDVLRGFGGGDTLDGGGGRDSLNGGSGADTLIGGPGNDILTGGGGKDTFIFAAGDGQDKVTDFVTGDLVKITGYASAQSIIQVGTDVVLTLSSTDKITFSNTNLATVQAGLQFSGGSNGGGGSAAIIGTSGSDALTGTAASDTIQGLGGSDTINGGAGNDRIIGGTGGDVLIGGTGSDVFVYTSVQDSIVTYSGSISNITNADQIVDFDLNHDRIDLSAIDADTTTPGKQDFIWGGSGIGHLVTSTFAGTDLVADTNGDGRWDLYIYFPGVGEAQGLTAANFIL